MNGGKAEMDKKLSDYISMVTVECEKAQIKPSNESVLDAATRLMSSDRLTLMLDKIAYGDVHHPGAIEKISMEIKDGLGAIAGVIENLKAPTDF